LAQPIEQGFAHAVRRGAQARLQGYWQLGTAPFAADDANLASASMLFLGNGFGGKAIER
jgi:hypothetical protein